MESPPRRTALVLALVAVLGCRGESGRPADPPSPFAVPAVTRQARTGRPVLFVGWDGADWQLLDRYLSEGSEGAEGGMPNLAALVREGRSGVLRTIEPPLSPLVWTTLMTGVSPLVHRVLDFTRFDPKTGEREPITRAERRVPAVWNMAGMAGRSAAVFGLWATWPAEPVDGLLVADRLFAFQNPQAAPPPGMVYPPAEESWARGVLATTEREVGFPAVHAYLPWLAEGEYRRLLARPDPYAEPPAALRRILVETAVYDRLAKEWLPRHRPDLTIVYFQGSDAIGHVFAPYAPPRQPQVSEADFARYSGVPRAYFADLDRRLGEYRKLAQSQGAVLLLASDHGFRWGEGRPERLASAAAATAGRWHREEGIYLLWGPGIAPSPQGGHPERGSVTQVAATLLALLGLPPGEGLGGPPLPGTPSPEAATPVHPLRYAEWFHPAPATPPAAGGSEELAKLKALGYVGAKEPARSLAAGAGGDDPTRTAGSYDNEGLLLRQEGRTAEARAAFEKALARDPGNTAALANLSDLLAQSAVPADRDQADALLGRALAAGLPDGVERVLARVAALRRTGEAGRALALLDRAIAASPEREEPRMLRGRLRLERQDCRGALADFTAAEAASPNDPLAWGSAALARLCLGDRDGAARDLRRSLALNPAQPEVARALAQIEGR